ncbi:hypothetical protein ACWDTI_14690 [Gordonia sp. NPDC003424]
MDAVQEIGTGVSAADRARTAILNPEEPFSSLVRNTLVLLMVG